MVASKHRSRRNLFRKCPKCLWLESGGLAGKGRSMIPPGHNKRHDVLFSQPLVTPEMAFTLLFDNKNVNRLQRVEFLLLILSNSWTLCEQLRFCLHIQQDTANEAICPQINYFTLHCFCGAKWMRCPLSSTSLLPIVSDLSPQSLLIAGSLVISLPQHFPEENHWWVLRWKQMLWQAGVLIFL